MHNDYRPIAVLPALPNNVESCVYNRLIQYLNDIGFWCDKQCGFLKASNTQTATVHLVTDIFDKVDKGLACVYMVINQLNEKHDF